MDYTKLINLIDKYLEEYNELQKTSEKCQLHKSLYNELMTLLVDDYDTLKENKEMIALILDLIYRDDAYVRELYSVLHGMRKDESYIKRYELLRKRIEKDNLENNQRLEEVNARIFRNRFIPASAKRVKACLKCGFPINKDKYDMPNIKRILQYYELSGTISNKEELLLINMLETHNRKVTTQKTNNPEEAKYMEALANEIPNILNAGYQENDQIEVNSERQPQLDKLTKEILNYLSFLDKEDIVDNLKTYSYNLNNNEYSYILTSILNTYLEELIVYYQLLIDREVYTKREERLETIRLYYEVLDKYLVILKYYNKINEFTVDDDEDIDLPEDHAKNKELVFSHTNNSDKVRIITDMKEVPYEYYKTVDELIDKFINNKLGKKEIKHLKNNGKLTQFIELRYDQVRIVLKHLNDSIYCVMGVAVKKSDNDMVMYRRLANRMIPDISTSDKLAKELELSKYTKKELTTLTEKKGRKGTR